MNEQTEQALAEMLDKINNGIDSASSFTLEQLPDVLNQLLFFKTVYHGLLTVVGCVIMIACIWLFVWSLIEHKNKKPWTKEHSFDLASGQYVGVVCGSGIGSLFSIMIFSVNLYYLLMVTLAPKIYLIEYAISLKG